MAYVDELVEELVREGKVCCLKTERRIITDRMGPWREQEVCLVWENPNGEMKLTPDEVEVLFKKGLTSNVLRLENGSLSMECVYCDARTFSGAIVCGVLAPSTKAKMRPEIVEYAKKMGYVTDTMTPVQMTSGIKSLIFNADGTYSVLYSWNESVLENVERGVRDEYTKNFFSRYVIQLSDGGVLIENLSEAEVFCERNIDLFRVYDIQLHYLSREYDKELLLWALIKCAFIRSPRRTFNRQFKKLGNIEVPVNLCGSFTFNEFGNLQLDSGKVSSWVMDGVRNYSYKITVPYSEAIRELMRDTEKIMKEKFGDGIDADFDAFREELFVTCNKERDIPRVEREIIALDYAITLWRTEVKYNWYQFRRAIISLLEADSTDRYKNVYHSYMALFARALPEKFDNLRP